MILSEKNNQVFQKLIFEYLGVLFKSFKIQKWNKFIIKWKNQYRLWSIIHEQEWNINTSDVHGVYAHITECRQTSATHGGVGGSTYIWGPLLLCNSFEETKTWNCIRRRFFYCIHVPIHISFDFIIYVNHLLIVCHRGNKPTVFKYMLWTRL